MVNEFPELLLQGHSHKLLEASALCFKRRLHVRASTRKRGERKMSKKLEKERSFEESISRVPKEIRKEHLRQILKNSQSLKDVSLELRKREANQTIYLLRCE